jgi:hypothetical protein
LNIEYRRKKLRNETIGMMNQLVSATKREENIFANILVEGITRNAIYLIADGDIDSKRQAEFWNSSLWELVIGFVSDICDQIESTYSQKKMIVSKVEKFLDSKEIHDSIPPETEFLRLLIASELVGNGRIGLKRFKPRIVQNLESTGLITTDDEDVKLNPLVIDQMIGPFREWGKKPIEKYLYSFS